MIDPNKSVIIFSHPRSGSTWMQDSLPQFNLGELFTLHCEITDQNLESKIEYKYVDFKGDVETELLKRFDVAERFMAHHSAVSIKIHVSTLTESICKFIEKHDFQYVMIERENKSDTFWSLLIALNTKQFHNKVTFTNITVPRWSFDATVKVMKDTEIKRQEVIERFSPYIVTYDELLVKEPSASWIPSKDFRVQNAKSKVKIDNLSEVQQWIIESKDCDFLA
jgi:hypothetical protein